MLCDSAKMREMRAVRNACNALSWRVGGLAALIDAVELGKRDAAPQPLGLKVPLRPYQL